MGLLKSPVKEFIESKNYVALNQLLSMKPQLANEGITIPFDHFCTIKAHPLHRICDGVFAGKISEDEAIALAKIFLANGAAIDGEKLNNNGTPLLAAASLNAEKTGIFYIDNGADVNFTYKNDGASALHWAAYGGLNRLVGRLIKANALIDEPDAEHTSTPMGWALHALITNHKLDISNYVLCIKLLLTAGADIKKLHNEQKEYLNNLSKNDNELQGLLKA